MIGLHDRAAGHVIQMLSHQSGTGGALAVHSQRPMFCGAGQALPTMAATGTAGLSGLPQPGRRGVGRALPLGLHPSGVPQRPAPQVGLHSCNMPSRGSISRALSSEPGRCMTD